MTTSSPSFSSVILQAAHSAAAGQHYPTATLYVVATPIGNLADITLRAIHVLSMVDTIACEDTRMTARLLQHLGLHKPLMALHMHNERSGAAQVIAALEQGQRVAYVSDAGTPAICDPGATLVDAVLQAKFLVMPIAGPSSVTTAMSVAGVSQEGGADKLTDSQTGFQFLGFLPSKGVNRGKALQQALQQTHLSSIFFESPHRIEAFAQLLAEHAADRWVTVCRELTKQFESIVRLRAQEVSAWLKASAQNEKGEFVIVIHPLQVADLADNELATLPPAAQDLLRTLLRHVPLKQAVNLTVGVSGLAKNAVYAWALECKDEE